MVYQTQENFPKIISIHVEATSETTFDYCSPEIARKRAEDMSDGISEPGKISKNYSEPFKAYEETIFDESVSKIDRQRLNYMSDDISEPGKISKKIIPSRLKHIERLFSLIALQKPVKHSRTI